MPAFLRKIIYRLKHNKRLYRLISPINGLKYNWPMLKARLLRGLDGNLAVFSAYEMRTYSDNPRYISEALHRLRPQTDIVWLLRDIEAARAKFGVPDYVRCVQFPSAEASAAAGRATVIVDNWRKHDYLRFSPRQYYIFSPHYDRGFKRAGLANPDFFFTRMAEEQCKLAVIGSDVHKPIFEQMYNYHGEFLIQGLPRNDILVRDDPAEAARIRAGLGVGPDTKLLIYAPTYRGENRRTRAKQAVDLDLVHALDTLTKATGEQWLCLYRAHYFAQGLEFKDVSARMIDATDYPEMAELLLISDAMITDYSSCAGDFALRGKPIWLYQADVEQYQALDRKLYFDPAEMPFWTAHSPEELDALIRAAIPEKARENCQAILDFYGTHESGRASELVAEYIAGKLK